MIPVLVGVGFTFVFILYWLGFKPGKMDPLIPDLFSYSAAHHSRVRIKIEEHAERGVVSRVRETNPWDDAYRGEPGASLTVDIRPRHARR